MVSSPPISAVIPNRDGADLLPRTLPPLLAELPPDRHEILVIDDGSEDDSVAMLAEQFPAVRVVGLQESVGFGAACNRGFQEAGHDLVLLLNSDMEVTAGSVELLLEHFEDPQVFAAGPEYHSAKPDAANRPRRSEAYWPMLGSPAGGGLFRRQAYLELGGFDPLYHPFYWEDIDLGWNAWRAGWRIMHDARAHFVHLEGATIARLFSPEFVARIQARNRCLFGWKNFRSRRLRRRHTLSIMRRAIGQLLRGSSCAIVGLREAWRMRAQAIAARPKTPPQRNDEEILAASETELGLLLSI